MLLQLATNGVLASAGYVLLASGFALSKRETGFFDFSYALQFSLGAYLTYTLYFTGLPLVVALLVACSCTALLGAASQRLLYAPLSSTGLSPLGLLIVSLAVYGTGQNVIALVWGEARLPFRPAMLEGSFLVGSAVATKAQVLGLGISGVTLIFVVLLIRKTKFGRAFRAVADDRELAALCRVPVRRYQVYAQAIAGTLAAVAGVVFALDTGVEPRMGFRALLVAVVAVIVGGGGNIVGTAVAAALLAIAQQLSAAAIGAQWQDAATLLLMAVALVFRPAGLAWRRS